MDSQLTSFYLSRSLLQLEYRTKYWRQPIVLINELTTGGRIPGAVRDVTASIVSEGKCEVTFKMPADTDASQVNSIQVSPLQ